MLRSPADMGSVDCLSPGMRELCVISWTPPLPPAGPHPRSPHVRMTMEWSAGVRGCSRGPASRGRRLEWAGSCTNMRLLGRILGGVSQATLHRALGLEAKQVGTPAGPSKGTHPQESPQTTWTQHRVTQHPPAPACTQSVPLGEGLCWLRHSGPRGSCQVPGGKTPEQERHGLSRPRLQTRPRQDEPRRQHVSGREKSWSEALLQQGVAPVHPALNTEPLGDSTDPGKHCTGGWAGT